MEGAKGSVVPVQVATVFHAVGPVQPARQLFLLACMIFIPVPATAANDGMAVLGVLQVLPPSVEYQYSMPQLNPALPPLAGPLNVTVVPAQALEVSGSGVAVVGAVGCATAVTVTELDPMQVGSALHLAVTV